MKVESQDLVAHIMEILGLSGRMLTSLTIKFELDKAPVLEIREFVGNVVTNPKVEVKRYKLVESDERS